MSLKKIILIVFFICLLLLLANFKSIYNSYLIFSLVKECNTIPELKDFIKNNPKIIDLIKDYPEISIILKNAIVSNPRSYKFFIPYYQGFITELKNNRDFMESVSVASTCYAALDMLVDNYAETLEFVKKHHRMIKSLDVDPMLKRYLCSEHPDEFKKILFSPDPKKTSKEIHDKFVIEKYLKL